MYKQQSDIGVNVLLVLQFSVSAVGLLVVVSVKKLLFVQLLSGCGSDLTVETFSSLETVLVICVYRLLKCKKNEKSDPEQPTTDVTEQQHHVADMSF